MSTPEEKVRTLRAEGYRFMVRNDRQKAYWVHPLEVDPNPTNWTDCTYMDDAEFDAFMAAGQIIA
jgi:hypothetical protein